MGQGGQEVLVGPTTHKNMATNDIAHSQANNNEGFCDFSEQTLQGNNRNEACKQSPNDQTGLLADRSDLRPGLPRVYWSSWGSL